MTERTNQPASPHGVDRWGQPVFGDGIRVGPHLFAKQPGQDPNDRDVFQIAFIGGRPGARDELVAFGWRYDAAAGEWEPYWQSVGPGSVPTARAAGEQQNETPEARVCGRTKSVAGTEYPPCGREPGHEEAYCRSADGKQHFLAVGYEEPHP